MSLLLLVVIGFELVFCSCDYDIEKLSTAPTETVECSEMSSPTSIGDPGKVTKIQAWVPATAGMTSNSHPNFSRSSGSSVTKPKSPSEKSAEHIRFLYKKMDQKDFDFYRDYLSVYYPKVFVYCNQLFTHMTPPEVEKSLQQLVNLFVEQPWFYFANTPKGFILTRYLEYVIDQLSITYDFLSRARVDPQTLKITLPRPNEFMNDFSFFNPLSSSGKKPTTKPLLSFLTGQGKTVIYEFYALIFDYLIKLFNEGIIIQDVKQASYYLSEMTFVSEKLRGSHLEQEYAESVKTAQQLLNLLKQKLNYQDDGLFGGETYVR